MYGYIYETTNLINGKKYIGQHRGNFDSDYYGSGKLILKAIEKYGKENFKVKLIEECNNLDELNKKEIYWISKLNADLRSDYYNIASGGSNIRSFRGINNPMYGKHHSEESKAKMSINQSISSWNKGTSGLYSKEYRAKISSGVSKSKKGKKLSESHRLAISKAMKNPEVRAKISKSLKGINNPMYGKHHSEESKAKISIGNKGKIINEKQRNIISERTRKAMKNPEVRAKISKSLKGKKLSESHRLAISKAVSKRAKNEDNPNYSYYTLEYMNKILYFSGRKALLCYCNKYFNLSEPIVRRLIKTSDPYIPTKYDIAHNRSVAKNIIIHKINKDEYYRKR